MEIKKLDECPTKKPNLLVKVTEMGNVVEVQYMSHRNCKQTIQMLPGGEKYIVCATGEEKDVQHGISRAHNKKGLYKTFANARGVINANVTDVSFVRWITLTYAENMTDPKRLYTDFRDFNKRFQYYCKTHNYGKPEYIVMMEPQGRGAWHAHLLYIWEHTAPFIPNNELAEIWGHGFTKIKKLDNVDNVGAYLTAYLGDMELSEVDPSRVKGECKIVEIEDENGEKIKKCFIKGARLHLYPAGFNMLRCSRGVKRPTVEMVSQQQAEKKVLGATKTFEKTVMLSDIENDFETIINTVQYNKIRGKRQ